MVFDLKGGDDEVGRGQLRLIRAKAMYIKDNFGWFSTVKKSSFAVWPT